MTLSTRGPLCYMSSCEDNLPVTRQTLLASVACEGPRQKTYKSHDQNPWIQTKIILVCSSTVPMLMLRMGP